MKDPLLLLESFHPFYESLDEVCLNSKYFQSNNEQTTYFELVSSVSDEYVHVVVRRKDEFELFQEGFPFHQIGHLAFYHQAKQEVNVVISDITIFTTNYVTSRRIGATARLIICCGRKWDIASERDMCDSFKEERKHMWPES